MVYKKIEYREFNSLEEIVRWEELNLDKKYKAIRGDLIYSHDPTAQAILQYSGFLYRPLNYYGRISSNAIIRCGNKKYIKYITDLVEFMYDFPIPENIVTYVVAFVSCTKYIRAPHDGQANGIHSIIGYLLLTILKIHAKSNERLCCARRSVNSES